MPASRGSSPHDRRPARPAPLRFAAEGDRVLRVTRAFAAPRPLVWRAMTEPALITRRLWARDQPMTRCEQDCRVGGTLLPAFA